MTSSVLATLQNKSPCHSPNNEPCHCVNLTSTNSGPLASKSVTSLAVGMAPSKTTTTPNEPLADNESSKLVHEMMAAARSRANKIATAAAPNTNSLPSQSPNFDASCLKERVEAAIASSTAQIANTKAMLTQGLIDQAKTLLAAPKIAPAELTAEEQAEAQCETAWNNSCEKKEEAIACAEARNQALFHSQELATVLIDAENRNLTVPDCDDLLAWKSNADDAAKKECTGVSVHKLIAKFSS